MKSEEKKKLVVRDIKILSVNELSRDLDFPELITIRSDQEYRIAPLDFGSLAYSIREQKLPTNPSISRSVMVNPESLIIHRRDVLLALFDHIFCQKMSSATLINLFHKTRNLFNALDSMGLADAFLDENQAKKAYEKYTEQLSSKIMQGLLADSTGVTRQNFFKWLISERFGSDTSYIIQGVRSMPSKRGHHRVPNQEEVSRFAETAYAAATVLTKFVLAKQNFPFLLEVRGFRKYIFPFYYSVKGLLPRLPDAVDYDTGLFQSVEDIRGQFPQADNKSIKDVMRRAFDHLTKSNNDERCESRLRMASIAAMAHALLIQLITGMSPSELRDIRFDDTFDSKSGQINVQLRSTKRRAKGMATCYVLGGKVGKRILMDYLRLRAWILNGEQCDYLFFKLKRKGAYISKFGKLDIGFTHSAIERIRKLFDGEEISFIGTSLARKYKSASLHERKVSTKLISSILNHSALTNTVSYTETTDEKANIEFQSYWESIRNHAAVLVDQKANDERASLTSNSVGACKRLNFPEPYVERPSIDPDCIKQFGCLYCKNYVFHADFEDIHKLASLKYVVREIRANASNLMHSDKLLQDLSLRIDEILYRASELSVHHSELVTEATKRVFDLGHLTDFWERRLARLEMNGQVII